MEGPFALLHLREMIYTGRLRGSERVRAPGSSTFQQLGDHDALREVLVLVGRLLPGEPHGERRISGWQSVSPSERGRVESRVAVDVPRAHKKKSPLILMVVALVVALVVLGALLTFGS